MNNKNILNIKRISCLIILFLLITCIAYANPFFGNAKSAPAPPVVTGGNGFFANIQFEYRDRIASLLREMKNAGSGVTTIFISASFLYGLFHAAGPGHRKTIIFSLFLSKKSRFYEPLAAGFLSAGIHAGASIFIILLIYLTEKTIAALSSTDKVYAYMEGFTFIIIAILAVMFIIIRVTGILNRKNNPGSLGNKGLYSAVIVTSLVPCPGATMVLIFAFYLGLIFTGIAGVLAMSAGMGIIISAAGYIAFAGREGVFIKFKNKESILKIISSVLEMISYFIILSFSVYMAFPFIRFMLK